MSDKAESFILTGVVHAIPPARVYNDKTYAALVLETEPGRYPQYPQFECRDTLSGLVANLGVGSTVKVHFNLRGREYAIRDKVTKKETGEKGYFTKAEAWKIDIVDRVEKSAGGGGGSLDDPDQDIPFAVADISLDPSPIAPVLRRPT